MQSQGKPGNSGDPVVSLCKDTQKIGATGRSKVLAVVVSFRTTSESEMEHTNKRRHTRYRGPIAKSEET
jgi:hypothetical protein